MAVREMSFDDFVSQYPAGRIQVDSLPDPDDYEMSVAVFEQVLDIAVAFEGKTYRIETESGRVMIIPSTWKVTVEVADE